MIDIKNKNILIIGDTIVDVSVEVELLGDSAEGLPTYRELSRKTLSGGAANVAKHCLQLGANVYLLDNDPSFTFTRDDVFSDGCGPVLGLPQNWVNDERKCPFHHDYAFSARVVKTRYYCGTKKVFKSNLLPDEKSLLWMNENPLEMDYILRSIIEEPEETEFGQLAPFHADLVIAADNRHGMFSVASAMSLVEACRKRNMKLLVDSQMSQERHSWFRWDGCSELFLNEAEWNDWDENGSGAPSKAIHLKMGRKGSERYVIDGSSVKHIESCWGFKVDVVDTVGAGDAYLAAWAVTENLRIANAWAAASCEQQGTKLPTLKRFHEILAR